MSTKQPPITTNMCFQIIPLCPACEEPAGLGEEIIYADDVCAGTCQGDDICGTTTRRLTQHELELHPDFRCLTPGCPRAESLNHSGSSSNGASASASGGSNTTRGGRYYRRACSAEEKSDREEEEEGGGGREGSETGDEDDRASNDNHNDGDEAEVQAARDRAKQFLRTRYQGCLSLCIIPLSEQAGEGSAAASMQVSD